ncbi:MAG TPA: phenylalanine--tRNA ligase subunit beta [Syntrophomonadaceae bacterium]|nr:phenylalanine--tRNA ligase subunit beta [Syntrophomonadaceae bacterium]
MGVPLKWLKRYIEIDWTPEELAHRLTMAGIAIEGIEKVDDDAILELDLTPNRGDCLGILNLAREVAALSGKPVQIPPVPIKETGEKIDDLIKIEIADPDLCRRYSARLVKNCQVAPSPEWMQECLVEAGIRPISNVVDVTNFVMLETNQPLHAFDYNLLGEEKRILVRRARNQELLTTLDDIERTLDEDCLLITDGKQPVALAGIMGGADTEINDQTSDVLIESACFWGTNIRKTSRKMNLRSDSSIRFEKGTDIDGVIYAANRAAQLLQDLAGGQVVAGVADVYPQPAKARTIRLRPERVNFLLGISLEGQEIKDILDKLGLKADEDQGDFIVEAPSYRPDLELEVDLIEEVARLYGYDHIVPRLPEGDTSPGGLEPYQKFRNRVRELMARNFYEVVNYSFINPTALDRIQVPVDSALRSVVKVANPLSEEQSVMRTVILPGLLGNIADNLARKNKDLAFFEIGAVFYPTLEGLPEEVLKLGAVVCGQRESYWLKNNLPMDFYYLKGVLEDLLQELRLPVCRFDPIVDPSYHPGRAARISCDDHEIGLVGEIHPRVLENYNIRFQACALELDVKTLFALSQPRSMKEEIPRYPAVERDIAVLVPLEAQASDLLEAIQATGGALLKKIDVFDIYAGDQVPAGKKSMAFRLTLQSTEKTLTEAEVGLLIDTVVDALQSRFGGTLR